MSGIHEQERNKMKPEFIVLDQGSEEWKKLKLGVLSGSNILRALAKKGTETRNTYMMELVGQIATRQFDEINAKALDHGKANEESARAAYEFETGHKVEQMGFIYGKDKRIGVSPDGLIPSIKKGLELKCPITAKVHADFLCNEKVKSEYLAQVQFSLFVSEYETWDFASFCPFFKSSMIKIKTFEKDPKMFERFENELPEFVKDLDASLKKIGLEFGQQWEIK
jgi:predicted phage-related endonuclease